MVDPKQACLRREVERLTRRFTSGSSTIIGPGVVSPAPDVGTDAIDGGSRSYNYDQGLPSARPHHREAVATRGVTRPVSRPPREVYTTCIQDVEARGGGRSEGIRIAIRGLRQRRLIAALMLAEDGATVIAISDSSGGLVRVEEFDASAAVRHKGEPGCSRASGAPTRSRTRSCLCLVRHPRSPRDASR